MIKLRDLYVVISGILPLYLPMFLGYSSVRWLNIFDRKQCSTISQFVAIFTIPFLCFDFISQMNPYMMNFRLIAADTLSKVVVVLALLLWGKLSTQGSLDWIITLFSFLTLPNTVIVGSPIISSMYGDDNEVFLVQLLVVQLVIWFNFLLVLYEFRAARIMIKPKLNENNCEDFQPSQRSDEKQEEAPVSPRRNDENGGQSGNPDDKVGHLDHPPNMAGLLSDYESAGNQRNIKDEVIEITEHPGSSNHNTRSQKNLEEVLASAQCKQVEEEGFCRQSLEVENATAYIERNENSTAVTFFMLRKVVTTVCRKLMRNPTLYASLLGLIWALLSHRFNIKKPPIMDNSVKLLSNAALGMAMFNLGLFMSLQPRIIACGTRLAVYGVIARFIVGPAVMAIASAVVGLRGTILDVAIVQASLPQAILSFIYANEYNVHPTLLSTAVIFGMIVSIPINVLYYIILGLF